MEFGETLVFEAVIGLASFFEEVGFVGLLGGGDYGDYERGGGQEHENESLSGE